MKKPKLIILTVSLLLLGASMITSVPMISISPNSNDIQQEVTLLKREPVLIEAGLPNEPQQITPSFSIHETFPPSPDPTVTIINFTDHEMALRGYGLDTVRVVMEFKSSQRAYFEGWAQLVASDSTIVSNEAYWKSWVDPDVQSFAKFDISGYEIRESGIDGPYNVSLRFEKDNGTHHSIYEDEFVHTTQAYTASSFTPRTWLDGITSQFIDNDGNGRYEWIDVQVTLNVTIPDNYLIEGYLQPTSGGSSEDAKEELFLPLGVGTVTLRFAAWDFREMSGIDTFSLTSLYIYHNTDPEYEIYSGNPGYITPLSYGSGDFDVPPIELTGRFWSETIDSDTDGNFNTYRVIMEINKTRVENGYCSVYASLYENSTGQYIDNVGFYSIELYSTGSMNVSFDFSGTDIYNSGMLDEYLRVEGVYGYYYHWDSSNWGEYFYYYDIMWVSADRYNFTDFDGPGASLTDNFQDYGFDEDDDGKFNLIIVNVEIDVFEAGEYNIYGALDSVTNSENFAWADNTTYLATGTHWLQLRFDGVAFFRRYENTSLRLDYIYLRETVTWTEIDYNNSIILSSYVFTDFNPPKARFTGFYSDRTVDIDDDGKGDILEIIVEVEYNYTGRYRVDGALRNPVTGQNYGVSSEGKTLVNDGTHLFVLSFPGRWIWLQHTITTYLLDYVYVYELDEYNNVIRDWDYRDDPFTTDLIYDSNNFCAPPAFFTGNFNEVLNDSDSDGNYNFLVIEAEVQVNEPFDLVYAGYYYYEGCNYWWYSYYYDIGVGTYWLELSFYTGTMHLSSQNRSYEGSLYLYNNSNWETLDSVYNYDTAYYDFSIFDPPSAVFTGNYYDQGIDSDGNERFDYVELAIELNIIESGSFHVYGRIYSQSGGSYYFSMDETILSPGLQNVTFEIDPSWFRTIESGSTLYIGYVYLYQKIEGESVEIGYNGDARYLAYNYAHEDFDLPDAWVTAILDDYGVDYNADGWYDFWAVLFEVNVTVEGIDLYFEATMYEQVSYSHLTWASEYLYGLSFGLHNITLYFSGESLYYSGFTKGTLIQYYRIVESTGWKTLDEVWPDFLLSGSYIWSDFNEEVNLLEIQQITPASGSSYDFETELTITVAIQRYSSEEVNWVEMEAIVDYSSYNWWSLYWVSSNESWEVWTGTIVLTESGSWSLRIDVHGTDGSFDSDSISFEVGEPAYYIEILVTLPIDDTSFDLYDEITFNTSIGKLDEEVANVRIDVYVNGNFYGERGLSQVYWDSTVEVWAVDLGSLDEPGTWEVHIFAEGNRGTSDTVIVTYYVLSAPNFMSFAVNSSSVTIGGTISFEAVIYDADGIANVTLHIGGDTYSMTYVEDKPEGELWTVDVTFTDPSKIGKYYAYSKANDTTSESTISSSITIYVNEGSEITDVNISPGTNVEVDTEISFTIMIRKSDAMITSVSLDVKNDDTGEVFGVALEKTSETTDFEIYGGSYTPETSGTYICTITVMNSKNQVSSHEETITVTGGDDGVVITPGFELFIVSGLFVLLPLGKRRLKN